MARYTRTIAGVRFRSATKKERREFRKVYKPRKRKVTYGKEFKTKRGVIGCYKYVNGRRVAFVPHRVRFSK